MYLMKDEADTRVQGLKGPTNSCYMLCANGSWGFADEVNIGVPLAKYHQAQKNMVVSRQPVLCRNKMKAGTTEYLLEYWLMSYSMSMQQWSAAVRTLQKKL